MDTHFDEVTTKMLEDTKPWAASMMREQELKEQIKEELQRNSELEIQTNGNRVDNEVNGWMLRDSTMVDQPMDLRFGNEL